MVPEAGQNLRITERREQLGTLPRRLGIAPSTALIVGFIIGSGIFRSPNRVALEAGSVRVALLAWGLGGISLDARRGRLREAALYYERRPKAGA